MDKSLLRILVVDDSEDDTLLLERELKHGKWEIFIFRVDTADKMEEALTNHPWDVVLSDYIIPGFGGMEALKLFNSTNLDIPFILISGKITEEMAVVALQEGAQDFVSKQNVSRLLPSIERGIDRAKIIAERKAATEALRESEMRYRLLADYAQECIFLTDQNGNFKYVSPACFRISGYTPEEFMENSSLMFSIIHPDDYPLYTSHITNLSENDKYELEYRIIHHDGSIRWIGHYCNAMYDDNGVNIGRRGSNRDITERKESEQSLKLFRSLIDHATDGIEVVDPTTMRFLDINATECRVLGYTREELLSMNIFDIDSGFTHETTKAMTTQMQQSGTFTFEGVHRRKDGSTFPVEINASWIDFEKPYILSMARDITERKQAEKNLHDSLIGTVRAVSDIVEMRDPYTAGHQKRVAALACAIAHEIGMPPERIEGLQLAAMIHDMGKIQIPSEILSKPTQLSWIEFQLIQTHSEAGYEILKDISFPWPIAETIRQHHEKLDGSGYPHGLKGDEIRLEARILTVADIVEAMASHRPYRPALGIEVALEEIQSERGIKLDADVVDACISLFRENRFSF
jgi:PAS domain S-box-containing protein/putative nucleotidyltransferase with HDIG domain